MMIPSEFHFLRPEWLLAFIPLAILGVMILRNKFASGENTWARYVDPHLLAHLTVRHGQTRKSRFVPIVGILATAVAIAGLAGPTWQEIEVPSFNGGEPTVVVLSLAQSMNATDLKPTRLKRSSHKLRDILERTKGDDRGLVIYSDAPFIAAPLTNDARVIEQMLPELSTTLMPVLGNRLDHAINEASALLKRADAKSGRIIVIADDAGDDVKASIAAARKARGDGYTVSVLAAGTEKGATLQTADGRAIGTRDGQTFVTRLSKADLQRIANSGGGAFATITAGEDDLNTILPARDGNRNFGDKKNEFKTDGWKDVGYWLLLLPVLLAPFAFRSGLIACVGILVVAGAMSPNTAQAGPWEDLWATPDQQAQAAFKAKDYKSASAKFDNPEWRAGAAYRDGKFAEAARDYGASAGLDKYFNLGNARAKSGDLKAALNAYNKALADNPGDADAKFNRDLVEKLLKKQQQKKKKQKKNQNKQQQKKQSQQNQKQQQNKGQSGQKKQASKNQPGKGKPDQKQQQKISPSQRQP